MARSTTMRVKNTSGITILANKVVYISSFVGDYPSIDLASNSDPSKMPAVGMTTEDIPNNSNGIIRSLGLIGNIDTHLYNENDEIFVGSNGEIAFTDPLAGGIISQQIGLIASVAVSGQIMLIPLEREEKIQHHDLLGLEDVEDHPSYSLTNGTRPFTAPVKGVAPVYAEHLSTMGYVDDSIIDDHGDLLGLGDDDHTQYLLIDGSRAMSGSLKLGGLTSSYPSIFNNGSDVNFRLADDSDYTGIDAVNYIQLNTAFTDGFSEGRLQWNSDDGTLEYGLPGGNVNLQVGQEFLVRAKNGQGSTIYNGDLVFVSGASGQRPIIQLADNSLEASSHVIGMATEDIANNQFGYVTTDGLVRDVDTSGCSDGDLLYLASSGAFSNVKPTSGYVSHIGICIYAHASQGIVYVHVQNSVSHGDLSDLLEDDHPQYTLRSDWDQNGFVDRDLSTMSWDDGTYTFTITPTGSDFDYFFEGVRYTTTGDSVQIDNTVEGIHWIYYDGSTLSVIENPTTDQANDLILNKTLVSFVYWDVSAAEAIYVGEERHGFRMSPSTHSYEHFNEGLKYRSGLGLNTFSIDGTGATIDAQFGVDSGAVQDEDIYDSISAVVSTTGLPIYYMTGANSDWNRYIQSGFSMRTFDGTSATRLAYNQFTGGAWQLTQVGNAKYVLYHIFATTEKDNPIISVMGQNEYGSINDARDGAQVEISELILDELSFPEIRPLGTIICQTSLGYTNVVNARIVSDGAGDNYVDWRSETISRVSISTSDHGALAGLGDNDHPQYLLISDASGLPTSDPGVLGELWVDSTAGYAIKVSQG